MEERDICPKTRRAHKRKQRATMFWRAFVFAFVITGIWLLRGILFEDSGDTSSTGANRPLYEMCGTADSEQKNADILQTPPDDETLQKLQDLVSQDQRVQEVIDNWQSYPEDILKMLSKNLDMLDFVLEYPENVGQVFAETIGEIEVGEIPLLLQYDQRWGYGNYGNSTVVVSGCGPTCLSMVIASLTGDDTITPYVVAQYANEQGYYVPSAGTSWTLMSEGAKHFGVIGEELPLTKSIMEGALNEGRPIICSIRPGDFTTTGHFIVITGMEDGQFTVNDPNSTERSNMLWDYETLERQISNLWAFRVL